jgi:antitoxin VapB
MLAFHVRDPATDAAVRELARLTGKTLTDTIREAVQHEYAAVTAGAPMAERLKPLQAQFRALKRVGGQPADKAFFDDLSGEP